MKEDQSQQPTSETVRKINKREHNSGKKKISIFALWAKQIISTFRLIRIRNLLLLESNNRVRHQKEIKSAVDVEQLTSIENIQKLININISILLNTVLIIIMATVTIATIYLLLPVSSTLIKLDLKVTSLEWITDDTRPMESERFNFYLESRDTDFIYFDTARITKGISPVSGYTSFSLRPTKSMMIEKIHFPKDCKIKLEHNNTEGMNMIISTNTDHPADSIFNFDLTFPQAEISSQWTGPYIMKGSTDPNIKPQTLSIRKNLSSGKTYTFNLKSVAPWHWPSGLYAKSVDFEERNAVEDDPVSSVINGKLNMLETNDSSILLSERDVIRTVFKPPVQLFLSGDSTGIYVHLEGEVSEIRSGPQIMGDNNNRMPKMIKVISEKAPYIWILITVIISFVTMIKIRDR